MNISKSLIDIFYEVLRKQTTKTYHGYNLRFLKRKKEVRLEKDSRVLVSWLIEPNEFVTYDNHKSTAEKSFVRKFLYLPQAVELKFQEEQKKTENLSNNDNSVVIELKDHLKKLKTEEITFESIDRIVSLVASKYVDEWYNVGYNPDKYADNFHMYYSFAKSRVWSELTFIRNARVEENLIKRAKLVPLRAQREGNLVLISELDHRRFLSLVDQAIEYAESYIQGLNPFTFLPKGKIQIYWWEKQGIFFSDLDRNNEAEPKTLRDHVLQVLSPNARKQAKPSRIELEVIFPGEDKHVEVKSYCPQYGIIEWTRMIREMKNKD